MKQTKRKKISLYSRIISIVICITVIILGCFFGMRSNNHHAAAEESPAVVSHIPNDISQLTLNKYSITNIEDWINLQTLSAQEGKNGKTLKGIQFVVYGNTSGKDTKIYDLASDERFVGLGVKQDGGNAALPFCGTIVSDTIGVRILTSTPLFQCISPEAQVSGLYLECSKAGGFADQMYYDGTEDVTFDVKDITFTYKDNTDLANYIITKNESAGMLFNEVKNRSEHQVEIRPVLTTSNVFDGREVGIGFEGITKPIQITGQNAGLFIGKSEGNVKFTYDLTNTKLPVTQVSLNAEDTDGGCGLLIGSMNGGKLVVTSDCKSNAMLTAQNSVGGLVGIINQTQIILNAEITISSTSYADATSTGKITGTYAGGICGTAIDSSIITTDDSKYYMVDQFSFDQCTYVGGICGQMRNSTVTNAQVSNVKSTYADGTGTFGGITGYITWLDQDNLTNLSKLKVDLGTTNNTAVTLGGCIGEVAGDTTAYSRSTDVELSDATVSADITDAGATSFGGITGVMMNGSSLQLDGTIDISNLQGTRLKQSYGSIVGSQSEALIYLQENGAISSPGVSCELDEVGTYGGVYRNNGKVIVNHDIYDDPDNTADGIQLVSSTTPYQFEVSSPNGMMRLAIYLNTNGRFGKKFFVNNRKTNISVTNMLKASYKLTEDINLTGTGIYSLNKPTTYFTGTITSNQTEAPYRKITYTQKSFTQNYLGLMGRTRNAVFQYLSVDADIEFGANINKIGNGNAGALCSIINNGITVDHVDIKSTIIQPVDEANQKQYYGGIAGLCRVDTNKDGTLEKLVITVDHVNLTVNHSVISRNHYDGGMFGYINLSAADATQSSINISNISVNGSMSGEDTKNSVVGGILACVDSGKKYDDENTSRNFMDAPISLNISNVNFNGLTMSFPNVAQCGGLLGYTWENVSSTITNITVSEDSNGNRSSINAESGNAGGFLYYTFGRTIFDTITLDSFDFTVSAGKENSGLLVSDARFSYMTVKDYTISNVSITNKNANMDEIVGINRTGDSTTTGGILNITSQSQDPVYYQNQVLPAAHNNKNTRYYYGLDQILENSEDEITTEDGQFIIDSPEKMVAWSAGMYANDTIKTLLFSHYSTAESLTLNAIKYGTYQFRGTLDLTTLCFYPVTVNGGNYLGSDAIIKFHGDDVSEKVGAKNPNSTAYQYYKLHSAVFDNVTGNVTISGFVLEGMVNSVKNSSGATISGALVCGTISNSSNTGILIDSIIINGVKINHSIDSSNMALLIYSIADSVNLKITNIQIPEDAYQGERKIASALIASIGSDSAKGIHVLFTDKIMLGKRSSELFTTALYAAYYKYSLIEVSTVRYNFTWEDYNLAHYTKGYELTQGVMYYDRNTMVGSIPDGETAAAGTFEPIDFVNDKDTDEIKSLLPYIKVYYPILINVRSSNITKGCGTYRDPYVIEDPGQLLYLYYFLSDNKDKATLLADWMVNLVGDDSTPFPAESYTLEKPLETNRDKMAAAYYLIQNDIDMSSLQYKDFIGLGTEAHPFTGVIIGRCTTNEPLPVITMPSFFTGAKDTNGTWQLVELNDYGLIMYARGAVLKGVIVDFGKGPNDKVSPSVAKIKYNAGAMAKVIGGDNIIDDVIVKGCYAAEVADTKAGGYVGKFLNGNVIFRNITKSSFADFDIVSTSASNGVYPQVDNLLTTKTVLFPFAGSMIGKIEDGMAFFEDNPNQEDKVAKDQAILRFKDGAQGKTKLPLCRTFQILNADYFKKESVGKIRVQKGDNPVILIDNAEQFEILTLAINSGALNYMNTDKHKDQGFNNLTHCRTSGYSTIGRVSEETKDTDTDYLMAVNYDNKSAFVDAKAPYQPYLNQFFADPWYTVPENTTATTFSTYFRDKILTIQLTSDGEYDLEQFQNSFRGIGSNYVKNLSGYTGSQFQGSLYGKRTENGCSTIRMNMVNDQIGNRNVETQPAGLFRSLSNSSSTPFVFQNFMLTGTVANTKATAYWDTNDRMVVPATSASNTGRHAGGIAGTISGAFTVNNVTIDGLTVQADGTAGSLFGQCSNTQQSSVTNVTFVKNEANTITSKITGRIETGGLIGSTTGTSGTVTVKNTSVCDCSVISYTCAGGMIGSIANDTVIGGTTANEESSSYTLDNLQISISGTKNPSYLGGAVGYTATAGKLISIQGLSMNQGQIKNADYIGGLIGYSQGKTEIIDVSITNNTIDNGRPDSTKEISCGGIIGYAKVSSLTVATTTEDKNQIENNVLRGNGYVGGAAGYMVSTSNMLNGRISNTQWSNNQLINSSNHTNKRYSGGVFGYYLLPQTTYSFDSLTLDHNLFIQSSKKSDYKTLYRMGGLMGEVAADENSAQLMADGISMQDNCIGYMNYTKLSTISADNCQMYDFVNNGLVEDTFFYASDSESVPEGALTELDFYRFASYTGNLFGAYSADIPCSVYDFTNTITQGNTIAHPVVDVGYDTIPTATDDIYAYRSKCKIYYGSSAETDTNLSAQLFTDEKLLSISNLLRDYSDDSQDAREKYRVKEMKDLVSSGIFEGTFSKTLGQASDINSYQSPFVQTEEGQTKVLPVIHYDAQYGDMNTIVFDYLAALTNHEMEQDIGQVSVTKAKLSLANGAYEITLLGDEPAIKVSDGKFIYAQGDTFDDDTKEGTISLIEFTYSYNYPITVTSDNVSLYSNGNEAQYTVIVPIFTEKILEINSYLRFSENIELETDQMVRNGLVQATINNNATYTIYAEFTYNGDFTRYQHLFLDRSLYFIANGVKTSFYPGTKLTLIDVKRQKVYYKELKEMQNSVPLTEFTDSLSSGSGNQFTFTTFDGLQKCGDTATLYRGEYPEQDVKDMGLEQYLIIVDTSGVEKVMDGGTNNKVYDIHLDKPELTSEEDYKLDRRLIQIKHNKVTITEYPGFDITLTEPQVGGSIEKNSKITISTSIIINAMQVFWQQYSQSENESFLEFQISLLEQGKQMDLPPGTKIYYSLSPEAGQVPDLPYKPGKINYFLDKDKTSKSLHQIAVNNTAYLKQTIGIDVMLDFSEADLSGYNGDYLLNLCLMRSDIADSPESGSMIDGRTINVMASSPPELAFAADTQDTTQLAMNTYDSNGDQNIEFTTTLDFNGFKEQTDLNEAVTNNFVFHMQLLEKTKEGYTKLCDAVDTSDGSMYRVKILHIVKDEEDNIIRSEYLPYNQETYSFTDTIEDLTQEQLEENRSVKQYYQLEVNTSQMDLSNYKLIITTDAVDKTTSEIKSYGKNLKDFFIFCIAQIKTD